MGTVRGSGTTILYDGVYSGHHVSYAKGTKMSTTNTILAVNYSAVSLFEDVPRDELILLPCKDPQSYLLPTVGWVINAISLLMVARLRRAKVHFLYADSIVHLVWIFSFFHRFGLFVTIHWATSVVPFRESSLPLRRRVARRIKFTLFSQISRRVIAVFVHGHQTRTQLARHYSLSSKIVEIPYGIECTGPHAMDPQATIVDTKDSPTVLFFGEIRYDKGIEQLAAVARLCPEYRFIVAGRPHGYPVEYVRDLFSGLENVQLMLRWIADDEVGRLFRQSTVLILPYRDHFSGQSGPLTIATAYGLPVLGVLVGDMGYDIQHFRLGVAVKDNSPGTLLAGLHRILNELKRHPDMYKASLRAYYVRGRWEAVGAILDNVYNSPIRG